MYRLLKALYGLCQAPRAWNARLDKYLKGLGFERCLHKQVVYTKYRKGNVLIVGVYVDDLLVAGSSKDEINKFKEQMTKQFEMIDLDLLSYYLGIEFQQGKLSTILKQSAYAKKILKKAEILNCN